MVVFVGDTLAFSVTAMDPDRTVLSQQFSVGDSVVSTGSAWNCVVTDTGLINVTFEVTDGMYSSRVMWDVDPVIPANNPPVITQFSPVEIFPEMIVGDQMEFAIQATDIDKDPIDYYFLVDDSLLATASNFTYRAEEIGDKTVTGVVTDGEAFATQKWFLTVGGVPDSLPPSEVPLLSVITGVDPGEIIVEWVAVGEDGMEGLASNYLLRTSPSPIIDEISWDRSSQRPNVPDPVAPGELMNMVVTGMLPARYTYVAVRAVDDNGNLSPLGPSLGGYSRGMNISGQVMDAITGEPLPGLPVELAHFATTTDAYGHFEFIELPVLEGSYLSVMDEKQVGVIGAYFDFATEYVVVHEDFVSVFLIPDHPLETTFYQDFLVFYLNMTEYKIAQHRHEQLRWELPIDLYCEPFQNEGLDYQATVNQVASDLGPYVNLDLFNLVGSEPDIGVRCIFPYGLEQDNFGYDLFSEDYYPLQGTCEFRRVYTPSMLDGFMLTIRHELGHAIGLRHSNDPAHLMVGYQSPVVSNFTPDEIAVIRAYYHVPRGLLMGSYSWE